MFANRYFGARYFGDTYFGPAAQAQPDVAQSTGATGFQHVKFTSIQDAEATFYGAQAWFATARFDPTGTADAFFTPSVGSCFTSLPAPTSSAIAAMHQETVLGRAGMFVPQADGSFTFSTVPAAAGAGAMQPEADASTFVWGASGVGATSPMYPYGVQNPTDEALAMLALQISRQMLDK
jgi:hypothetical protein